MRQTVVGGILVSRLVLHSDFFGLYMVFLRTRTPYLLKFLVLQILLSCTNNLFLRFFLPCIAVGDCFENSLTNAYCTVLFDCDRVYSNTQSAFSLPVKGISISVKIETSYFDLFNICCHNEKIFGLEFA